MASYCLCPGNLTLANGLIILSEMNVIAMQVSQNYII